MTIVIDPAPRVLITMRIRDLDEAPPTPSRVGTCSECQAAVWISESSPAHDVAWCVPCAKRLIPAQGNVQLEPLTAKQKRELQDFRRAYPRKSRRGLS